MDFTGDVEIGRDGRTTRVRSDLLKVGQENDAGQIDSGGTGVAPQKLKIGTTGQTDDISLGRASQTVDLQCQARMNSNGIVMNNAANLVAANGCGMVFNAVGLSSPEVGADS